MTAPTAPFLEKLGPLALPKVSRSDNEAVVGLQRLWKRVGFAERLTPHLEQVIGKHVGDSCSLSVDRIFSTPASSFCFSLPTEGLYLQVGMTPLEEKLYAEVDLQLAHLAIDRLLGGTGEPLGVMGVLSEVEEGVLSYLVLKILSEIHGEGGERLHFRLEGVASSWKEWPIEKAHSLIVMVITLRVGHRSGYLKIFLPIKLVQRGFLEAFKGLSAPGYQEGVLDGCLEKFGWMETTMRLEVGTVSLKGKEIAGLAKGDVVLLEAPGFYLDNGKPAGLVTLRVGKGSRPLKGKILSAGKRIEVSLL